MNLASPGMSLLALFALLGFQRITQHGNRSEVKQDETLTSAVSDAIDLGTEYLLKQLQPDGTFIYRININPSVELSDKYNILRHAGTVYALAMSYERNPDDRVADAIRNASVYLRDFAAAPLPYEPWLRAIWSDPAVNYSSAPMQAKLGGSGLGLVALVSMEHIEPGFTDKDQFAAIGRFIVSMQRPDGSFYSRFRPTENGRNDSNPSLFYPGEAALGLVMLYELDGDPIWLASASRALAYLADSRRGDTKVPTDHWALLATAKLLTILDPDDSSVSIDMLIEHAAQICSSMLKTQVLDTKIPDVFGGFTKTGKTTPTATRLEGLLAALEFLPQDHQIRPQIESAVTPGVSFLVNAQLKDGQHAGGIPHAVIQLDPDEEDAAHFNKHATEIRIDYVQHAMSAMIQYLDVVETLDPDTKNK